MLGKPRRSLHHKDGGGCRRRAPAVTNEAANPTADDGGSGGKSQQQQTTRRHSSASSIHLSRNAQGMPTDCTCSTTCHTAVAASPPHSGTPPQKAADFRPVIVKRREFSPGASFHHSLDHPHMQPHFFSSFSLTFEKLGAKNNEPDVRKFSLARVGQIPTPRRNSCALSLRIKRSRRR